MTLLQRVVSGNWLFLLMCGGSPERAREPGRWPGRSRI